LYLSPPLPPLFPYTTLFRSPDILIELEADSLQQVREFVRLPGVDVILLDNMNPDEMRACVALRRPGLKFEASGGVNMQTVRSLADRKSTRLNSSHQIISYAV